ncbi:MAG: sugar transferase [Lachnospiraceae bacterium]|nr:sugar transferase [Lachnospiraceae bacterium]
MYKKRKKSWEKHLDFTILDMLCLELAYGLAYVIRLGVKNQYMNEQYMRLAIVLLMVDICVVFFSESYKGILRRNNSQELQSVVMHTTVLFVGMVLYMYVIQQSSIFSRQLMFIYWGLSIVFEFIGRSALKVILKSKMINEKRLQSMIVVTTEELVETCLREFEDIPYREFVITGVVVVDAMRKGDQVRGIPVVANADDFYEYVRTHVVDEVFINGNTIASSQALADELLEMGITVHFNLVHESKLMPNKVIEKCGKYMVLTSSMRIATPRQLLIKRTVDILAGFVGLVFTGIAFLVFAPIIKHQSPGPVFFAQTRVGKNGRKFRFYKFRSMNVGAELQKEQLMEQNEMSGHMFKLQDDPRIFPIGRFMRKYSIDELPQFWNILKGDMSLVGTRPPTEDEFEAYEMHHKARLSIRPGLTGMWQVNGRSEIRDFEEVVQLDTYYITNWSLALDVKIILRTIQVVLSGKGSE